MEDSLGAGQKPPRVVEPVLMMTLCINVFKFSCESLNYCSLVYRAPKHVRTPLALFTAEREKAPATGNEWTNDPITLQMPSASSSCVASIRAPLAVKQNYVFSESKRDSTLKLYKKKTN